MSGSSGGGSSGKVEYPTYMQTVHNDWLDNTGTDTMTNSINDLMEVAIGSSPYATATAYDPATPLADAWTAVCALNTLVDALDHESDWSSAISAAVSDVDGTIDPDTELASAVTAIGALNTLIDALSHTTDWGTAIAAAATGFDTNVDADTELADGWSAITAFNTLIDALDHEADWASALAIAITGYDSAVDDDDINDDVQAYSQVQYDDIKYNKLPDFRAGYRDVNAVLSSAFVIGESVIFGMHQRDVAKYAAGLKEKKSDKKEAWLLEATKIMLDGQLKRVDFERAVAQLSSEHKINAHTIRAQAVTAGTGEMMRAQAMRVEGEKVVAQLTEDHYMKAHAIRTDAITKSAELMLRNQIARVEYEKAVAQLSVEAKRLHIVASKEETDQQYSFDDSDARWDMEVYQYGCNVLAAISGAAASVGKQKPSAVQSALGGALSGAAMGAAIPGVGPLAGGILGAGAALLGL